MKSYGKLKCLSFGRFSVKESVNKIKHVNYEDIVNYLYQPRDPSSLGVIRALFGLLMLIDLPEERGGSDIHKRWGNPRDCHFPLFPILKPLSCPYMSLLYGIMWIGALGIFLGYKFRISTFLFGIPFWYILLIDKSFWNNHSYLFGVVTILLMGSSANHFLSLDGYLSEKYRNKHVPYWNYFILKFQFFLLYFLAGLKKTDLEWLEGYSVRHLGDHWVFTPFQLFLLPDKIDYIIVHWFGFLLDLTIGFWMIIEFTRPVAMFFCACFHFMNSRLFSIGMFPYVCLATLPLFCEENWPKKVKSIFSKTNLEAVPSTSCIYKNYEMKDCSSLKLQRKANWRHKFVVALLICHCGLQIMLPYSHFITKGYNNWTNGLYGYSWDMMVHSWDTILVVIKVVDNKSRREHFVGADAWTPNNRWNKHADMCVQYAQCLKDNLLADYNVKSQTQPTTYLNESPTTNFLTSEDISIYIDVWCSLNKRFQQRMYNPYYDLLKAKWSPFEPVEWLLPVLSEYNNFRQIMETISNDVYSWSNQSDVLFITDFPGLHLENYINEELTNVTLTVLDGEVAYEIEDEHNLQSLGVNMKKGESVEVEPGIFHRIHTISETPSCYMYTFNKVEEEKTEDSINDVYGSYSPFPLVEDIQGRTASFLRMWSHVGNSIMHILFNKPYSHKKDK